MATRSHLLVASVFAAALLFFASVPSAHASLLKPKLMDSESYGETWTAIADLEDGTYVLLQYVFTNAGMGDGKGACRALVVPPGKKGHNAATRVDRDEWSYNSAKKSLKVGACTLSSSGGRTTFSARAGKLSVRLTLREGLKRVRPPGHRVRVDDDFFEAEVLVPWADATADVKAPGYSKRGVAGKGFLDHTRSTAMPPDVASKWFHFRGFHGGSPAIVKLRLAPKAGSPSGWIWQSGEAKPSKVSGAKLRGGKGGKPSASMKGLGGSCKVAATKKLFTYKPAEAYGVLGKMATTFIGETTTTTWRATLTKPDGTKVQGILEQTVID